MRRALAILKYVPAVLCGLLVVAWVVSFWLGCELKYQRGDPFVSIVVGRSNICAYYSNGHPCATSQGFRLNAWFHDGTESEPAEIPSLQWGYAAMLYYLRLPHSLVLSLVAPLAMAVGTRFRFPLWSCFAWTALIAAELAYYLRA